MWNEHAVWCLDQRINDRGLPVDLEFARQARHVWARWRGDWEREARRLTGLDNPNSRAQMLGWLRRRGVAAPSLSAEAVRKLLESDLPSDVHAVLKLRQRMALTSPGKIDKLIKSATADGRLRGTFAYHGAHTGRWAGRGVQPHNFPRGLADPDTISLVRRLIVEDDQVIDLLWPDKAAVFTSILRSLIAAPPGKVLVVADYASIETVVLAFETNCAELKQTLLDGRDPYKAFATRIFATDYDSVTKTQRTLAKPAVLGCGYQLGGKGLAAYGESMGVSLPLDEAAHQVRIYRSEYGEVPQFWADLVSDVKRATSSESDLQGRYAWRWKPPFLRVELPSGRLMSYYMPMIEVQEMPWGDMAEVFTSNVAGRYRSSYHGGKLTENIVQAVARDLLVEGMYRADQHPLLEVVGHVHDEIICLADEDRADDALTALLECMCPPEWYAHAPVRAEGWIGKYYRKD